MQICFFSAARLRRVRHPHLREVSQRGEAKRARSEATVRGGACGGHRDLHPLAAAHDAGTVPVCGRDQPGYGSDERAEGVQHAGGGNVPHRTVAVLFRHAQAAAAAQVQRQDERDRRAQWEVHRESGCVHTGCEAVTGVTTVPTNFWMCRHKQAFKL